MINAVVRRIMATTTTKAPVKPLLPVQSPVPSDVDIAQSIKPKHISQIAEAGLELRPEEYELYGPAKAKVPHKASHAQLMAGQQQLNPLKYKTVETIIAEFTCR